MNFQRYNLPSHFTIRVFTTLRHDERNKDESRKIDHFERGLSILEKHESGSYCVQFKANLVILIILILRLTIENKLFRNVEFSFVSRSVVISSPTHRVTPA